MSLHPHGIVVSTQQALTMIDFYFTTTLFELYCLSMKKITIILGHPCSQKVTFCRSLAEAYIQGAEAAGHSAEFIDISKLDIPYLTQKSD